MLFPALLFLFVKKDFLPNKSESLLVITVLTSSGADDLGHLSGFKACKSSWTLWQHMSQWRASWPNTFLFNIILSTRGTCVRERNVWCSTLSQLFFCKWSFTPQHKFVVGTWGLKEGRVTPVVQVENCEELCPVFPTDWQRKSGPFHLISEAFWTRAILPSIPKLTVVS